MGNTAISRNKGDSEGVTVLQADGKVLTVYHTIRVADLMIGFPNHFVCHSNSLVLLQQGKILPLHTVLTPGEIYFLLPLPGRQAMYEASSDDTETSSLLHVETPPRSSQISGSMKFVISKEQFAKIIEGSSSTNRPNAQNTPSAKRPMMWQPGLASIAEVTAK